MSIGLGIGVSHAAGMYLKTEEAWDDLWRRLSLARDIPQPAAVYGDCGEKLGEIIDRIENGHRKLKAKLDEYKPDVLIVLGGDQSEVFDRSNVPQLMMYLGACASGNRPGGPNPTPGQPLPPSGLPPVNVTVDVEFSRWLLTELVKREGFDIAFSSELRNLGRGGGLPHAFCNPLSYLLEGADIPTVILYQNTYDPPSLSARRCYALGEAIARLTRNVDKRIAILGSGGLAHNPGGKRSGWLDQPLDRWFLGRLEEGDGRATQAMYMFDSDTMAGGTGENRAWITVAGAMETMGAKAEIVDYVEAPKTATGLGFAFWSAPD